MSKKKEIEQMDEQQLSSLWSTRFKQAMVNKAPYTRKWMDYLSAYRGEYFKNANLPEYKSDQVSNYIFSIVETVRPIMLDNDPKFEALPRQREAMEFTDDLQEAFMYEWDREKMNTKMYRELINTLVLGTAVVFLPWNSEEKNVNAVFVNPFNIFPDPLATSIETAEYIIYANYQNVVKLRQLYPEKAEELYGGSVQYSELVNENDRDGHVDNQVLVLEVWTRDYELDEEIIDGEKKMKPRYPHGRVITMCPDLGLVLEDKKNPYQDKTLPFRLLKDYDVPGKFWGEGEVEQLISPQKYMNELSNAIVDNAKATANMPWIIDKNSGIPHGKITARPGLVIRKNSGSEVKREQPPAMPHYVANAVETYKSDIEQISGIYNTLKGDNTTGVYTAQGILALQEAGQVRIRLKVKILEEFLSSLATMWYSRMKQFWKEDRWVRISRMTGDYDMKLFTTSVLKYDYDVKISAGSTMPVNRGAMLDLMIRLAQTPMPDGQMLVDREAVVQYLPQEAKGALLGRMADKHVILSELQEGMEMMGQQMEEMGQAMQQGFEQIMQQTGQQIQEVAEESAANDEQIFKIIEEITQAIEQLNGQVGQVQEENAIMTAKQQEEEKINQIKHDAYNKGFTDAESEQSQPSVITEEDLYGEDDTIPGLEEMAGLEEDLPDDLLEGIEDMTDDELAILIQQNPEIAHLIR